MSSLQASLEQPANNNGWSDWVDQEKVVLKNNLPLVIGTSLATAVYSYTMIDKSANNAINRGLLMALSTFLGASITDLIQQNGMLDPSGNGPMATETVLAPLIYYWINNRQFQLPELQSEAIKTGVVSIIAGQVAKPYVEKRWNSMDDHN